MCVVRRRRIAAAVLRPHPRIVLRDRWMHVMRIRGSTQRGAGRVMPAGVRRIMRGVLATRMMRELRMMRVRGCPRMMRRERGVVRRAWGRERFAG
jgi:hypothetical protein